jgi:hypothetical protein
MSFAIRFLIYSILVVVAVGVIVTGVSLVSGGP